MDNKFLPSNISLSNKLRSEGIATMLYPEVTKLQKQFKYADDKQIPFAAIIGDDEQKQNKVALKNMSTGVQSVVTFEELVTLIKKSN
jgi:histidyl-tRNA synthetase